MNVQASPLRQKKYLAIDKSPGVKNLIAGRIFQNLEIFAKHRFHHHRIEVRHLWPALSNYLAVNKMVAFKISALNAAFLHTFRTYCDVADNAIPARHHQRIIHPADIHGLLKQRRGLLAKQNTNAFAGAMNLCRRSHLQKAAPLLHGDGRRLVVKNLDGFVLRPPENILAAIAGEMPDGLVNSGFGKIKSLQPVLFSENQAELQQRAHENHADDRGDQRHHHQHENQRQALGVGERMSGRWLKSSCGLLVACCFSPCAPHLPLATLHTCHLHICTLATCKLAYLPLATCSLTAKSTETAFSQIDK